MGNTPEAWLQRVHPDDRREVSRALEAHLADGPDEFAVQHRMLHKDGSYRWMFCRGTVQRSPAGQPVRVLGCHSQATADTVADSVTGLPNRVLFLERLARSIERAGRYSGFHFAVLCIQFDRPAGFGASPGAATGDPLLTAVARRLETCLRTGDTPPTLRNDDLVARGGG